MYLHSQLSLNIFLPLSLLYTINSDYITALVPEAAELPPPDIRFPGICEPLSILGTFPEQAKLAEIAKYSHYVVQPVKFAEDGALVEEEPPKPKKAPPRRRFR